MHLRWIAAAALWLAFCGVQAREPFDEGRIGAGVDVIHEPGRPMASVSLYPASFLFWERNFGAGLAYTFGQRAGWNAGLGGMLVQRKDEDVGTHLNLFARLSYCGGILCLSFAHISHGAALGIRPHDANSGLNFLFLEYRYW